MKRKILIILLILIFIYCLGGVVYSLSISTEKENDKSIVLKINNYDYSFDDFNNSLYKNEFNILKNNLENENINYEEYVKSIAKLYIIDLYSLDEKNNKYDVSSSQYVLSNIQDNYKLKVSETLYKYIKDNSDGNRNQELPLVTDVIINSVEKGLYTYENTEYEAYDVNIKWVYEKDLGYDNSAILTLIKKDNNIYVVEEKRISEVNQDEISS